MTQICWRELETAKDVVIIGAGFIGLEFAATAVTARKNVTVVEVAPRVMGRAVSPQISDFFAAAHREFGATLLLGTAVRPSRLAKAGFAPCGLPTEPSFRPISCSWAFGKIAEDQLTQDCGLACDNGIVVDAQMGTSDAYISAIGDCCSQPIVWHGGNLRLESVQNATDQALRHCQAACGAGGALFGATLVLERSRRPETSNRRSTRGRPTPLFCEATPKPAHCQCLALPATNSAVLNRSIAAAITWRDA